MAQTEAQKKAAKKVAAQNFAARAKLIKAGEPIPAHLMPQQRGGDSATTKSSMPRSTGGRVTLTRGTAQAMVDKLNAALSATESGGTIGIMHGPIQQRQRQHGSGSTQSESRVRAALKHQRKVDMALEVFGLKVTALKDLPAHVRQAIDARVG